jgi:hypothetical protein
MSTISKRFLCLICDKKFTRHDNLKRHIDTIHQHVINGNAVLCPSCHKAFVNFISLIEHRESQNCFSSPDSDKTIICSICGKSFNQITCLLRHTKTFCMKNNPEMSVSNPPITEQHSTSPPMDLPIDTPEIKEESQHQISDVTATQLEARIDQLSNEIKELKHNNTSHNLQIVCVGNKDNYLDMLTGQMGDFDQALEYIKDCALSELTGDCKLIEKIYGDTNNSLGFYIDKRNSNITYHNEKNEQVVERKDTFVRKLANNLQNSYLKGVTYLINFTLDHKIDPNKFLDNNDLMMWNDHIYKLLDQGYQRKIINNLHIPTKPPI